MAARYDAGRGRVVISLSTGIELGHASRDVEGQAGASADDLKAVEIDSQGQGIHFPKLDADLYVAALLEGVLGSRRWMDARLGAARGQARSPKVAAARDNGRRDGRPASPSRAHKKRRTRQPRAIVGGKPLPDMILSGLLPLCGLLGCQ